MTLQRFVCMLLFSVAPGPLALPAQTTEPPQPEAAPSAQSVHLDVVVNAKSGLPVADLGQKDFTVLDNKSERPITFFKTMSNAADPVNVILLLDAVNMPYQTVAYARAGTERFLKLKEGQLANPTALAVLTDQGMEIDTGFLTDGNALSDILEHKQIGLREITRSSEWSGPERLQICINALHQMITLAASMPPGRKIVVWISPGWPLVSGPRVNLDTREEQRIFNEIVTVSTQLRQNQLTLYNVNPLGVTESLQEADLYEAFVKGVSKPSQVQLGNLAVQVLAIQSGGVTIEGNSDVPDMIQRCLKDANSWYEIGFDPLPVDKPNEYHHIEIKVGKPGLVARTRDGYYANPVAIQPR